MKLVSGRSLAKVIEEKGTLEERLALLPHIIAATDAMAYAHQQRGIHRDLKPSNVLIGPFGETLVIDWGLATDLSRSNQRSDEALTPYQVAAMGVTVVGAVLGTPEYMPPEQAAGRTVDERADVYSLGAILYHVLSGGPPYTGVSSAEVIDKVSHQPP